MKKTIQTYNLVILVISALLCGFMPSRGQTNLPAECDNLDFRRGDFTGWSGVTTIYRPDHPDANNCSGGSMISCPDGTDYSCNGCYSLPGYQIPLSNPYAIPYYRNNGIVPGRHTIMKVSKPDPYACNNINTLPPNEPYCARIGNGGWGPWGPNGDTLPGVLWEVDYLSYSYVVGPSSNLLTYKYAVMLQDVLNDTSTAPHSDSIRPRFIIKVMDENGQLIDPTCGKLNVIYDTTLSGFRECSYNEIRELGGYPAAKVGTAYRAWTTIGVDLRNYVGKKVTLEFNTWDCGWSAHFGYAYVTARCDAFKLNVQNCTTDGNVLIKAPDGFSYKWSTGETTRDIIRIKPNPGDSVWVELTTVQGCKTSIGARIYPVLMDTKFTLNPSEVCPNQPVSFVDLSESKNTSNNSNIPVTSRKWTFGDGTSSNLKNPSHAYRDPGKYIINLIVTNQSGCVDSLKRTVQVLPGPKADFVVRDICVNDSAKFKDASTVPLAQSINGWAWTYQGNNTSNKQNPSVFYGNAGVYDVKLEVTASSGCKDDTIKRIKVYDLPTADFNAISVCQGDTTFFTNTSKAGDPDDDIVSSIWNFGDGSPFRSAYNVGHTYLTGGTNKVELIVVSKTGCVDNKTNNVIVYPKPKADFTTNFPCLGDPVSFTDKSTPLGIIKQRKWFFDDVSGSVSNEQNPIFKYASPKLYYPKLVVSTENGCADSLRLPLEISPYPVSNFDADKYSGCAPLCVNFVDLSYSISDKINQWNWDFGDGSSSSKEKPDHCYNKPGIYTVSQSISSEKGCKSSFTRNAMIQVYPSPDAKFTADPLETTEKNPIISFQNQSTGEVTRTWYFGDNNLDTIQNPVHTYQEGGKYKVWLYVTNQFGCKDSVSIDILINKEWTFFIPSAFTPNASSGDNDGFIGRGTNIKKYEMWIFDRWGEMIYYCDSMDKPWNGKVSNGLNGETTAQSDVYVWKIQIVDLNGETRNYSGTVTLLR